MTSSVQTGLPTAEDPSADPLTHLKMPTDEKKQRKKQQETRKRWKKPKDMPKRPLSAYNLFFAERRQLLLSQQDNNIGFADLGRIIGSQWKTLDEENKQKYVDTANEERKRYQEEMKLYKEAQAREAAAAVEAAKSKRDQLHQNVLSSTSLPINNNNWFQDDNNSQAHQQHAFLADSSTINMNLLQMNNNNNNNSSVTNFLTTASSQPNMLESTSSIFAMLNHTNQRAATTTNLSSEAIERVMPLGRNEVAPTNYCLPKQLSREHLLRVSKLALPTPSFQAMSSQLDDEDCAFLSRLRHVD